MLVCAISDTHNRHSELQIPGCDLLLHAGDFSGLGTIRETKAFFEWFSKQPSKHKVFISGNHDALDYEQPTLFKELLKEYPGITYLRDEGIEIEGIKIWGRPWTPSFFHWSFMADRGSSKMLSSLSIVPTGIDIFLTHGPAYGILDLTSRGERVGCQDMLNELECIQPKVVVCGHIHHSSGVLDINGVKHINASVLNDNYKHAFKPILFQL